MGDHRAGRPGRAAVAGIDMAFWASGSLESAHDSLEEAIDSLNEIE